MNHFILKSKLSGRSVWSTWLPASLQPLLQWTWETGTWTANSVQSASCHSCKVPACSLICCSPAWVKDGAGSIFPVVWLHILGWYKEVANDKAQRRKEWGMLMFLSSAVAAQVNLSVLVHCKCKTDFYFVCFFEWVTWIKQLLSYLLKAHSEWSDLDLILHFEVPELYSKCYTICLLMARIYFVPRCKEEEWEECQTQQKACVLIWMFLSVHFNWFYLVVFLCSNMTIWNCLYEINTSSDTTDACVIDLCQ